MSSKDKDTSKTLDKLKQFFRINKGGTGNLKGRGDFALTADIERDLSPETPLNQRTKAIKDLSEAVLNNRLEDNSIEKLWQLLQDLFHRDVAKDTRHLAFYFFRCLVQGQYEMLGQMRVHFFRLIKSDENPEDVAPRLDLLVSLTENGKDILFFEEEVGPFLLQWMPSVNSAGKNREFLSMLVNIIKFNAAYIDEHIVKGLVENTCFLCCYSRIPQEVLTSLLVLDTVVCYSNLPSESLPDFVSALCRTVNNSAYCQDSWKIMRNLLGTHMGHSTLYTMCRMLQDPASLQDKNLLRGAVFYINMGLWGNSKVTTLKYTPMSVLPSLLNALECNQPEVVYEVMLSIQRLVNKYGLELFDPSWDLVLSILEYIIRHIEESGEKMSTGEKISTHLHETICTIEQLIELGQFNGSVRRVFELIERLSPVRPEGSVLRLVSYVAAQATPTRSFWISRLNDLMDRYFRQEKRTNIRIKVVDILASVVQANRAIYEDDLIERIIVPHFQHIESDPDIVVRNASAQLLVELCKDCESKRCLELLDILQKLMNRPFDLYSTDGLIPTNEADVIDVKTTVIGLINIFIIKLYRLPSSHCVSIYKLLVTFLETHYYKPQVFDHCSNIRYMIFDCFLRIRANSICHLGYPGPTGLQFSPYIAVDHKEVERVGNVTPPPMSPAPSSYPHPTVTYLSMSHACKAVIMCLKHERDWKVLLLVLTELPKVLKNKALILCRHGNDVNLLADVLSTTSNDKMFMENLRNTPPKFARADYQNYVFPVLAALASYHTHLEPNQQQRLIKAMEIGLTRQCARQCITCLTLCILEMRDAMFKMLPEVLLGLSKMSAAVYIAIPILEFLATLPRLPKVFASFVADQYMSVFAISLPYTNPFKYNHYTVSLAHHVIAVWFLKCRQPFRKDFVKFITTGLKANVLVPFEEGKLTKMEIVNEDSSNRKRASSLTEQGSRRVRPMANRPAALDLRPQMDGELMVFHQELTETCIDLMARYTFNTCSALPKRHPTAEFLLNNGQSMTWLLGHKLITVTTSGCSQKALKNGLCDKCWSLCRIDRGETNPQSPDGDAEMLSSRHRARARVQRTMSTDVTPLPPLPKDVPGKDSGRIAHKDTPSLSTNSSVTSVPGSRDDINVPLRLTKQLSVDVNPRGTPTYGMMGSTSTSPVDETQKSFGQSEQPEVRSRLEQLLAGSKEQEKEERMYCACWCQNWAEIYVRRPTGDMSWVIRIQNPNTFQSSPQDLPLLDISTLFLPSLSNRKIEEIVAKRKMSTNELAESGSFEPPGVQDALSDLGISEADSCQRLSPVSSTTPITIPSPSRQSSRDSLEEEPEANDIEGKSRNPVRRSNSSPEMSANWKNPFLKEKKETESGKQHKDPRVSCEAIPEELSQTAPSQAMDTVPALLSVHSDPGVVEKPDPQSTVPCTSSALASPVSGARSAFTPVFPSFQSVGQSPSVGSSAAQSPAVSSDVTSAIQSPSLVSSSVLSPSVLSSAVQSPSMVLSAVQSPSVQSPSMMSSATQSPAAQSPSIVSGTLQASVVTSRPPQSPKLQQKGPISSNSSPSSPLTIDTGSKKPGMEKSPLTPGRDDSARLDPSALSPLAFKRDRGHTISVMSPVRKPRIDWSRRDNSRQNKEGPKSGINPSFVFLQLYHNTHFNSSDEKPLLLSQDDVIQRSIKILDHIPPYETHKIGVLYVGPGQASNEAEILRNQFGSLRYAEFLHRLGKLIRLKDVDPQITFLGGLHKDGNDGKFAYIWQDDVMQVTFHVATLMPTKESDPHSNDKKLHIGNDYVTIVYNESGEEYNIQTVKGQFNYACVVIQPLDHATNEVIVKTREDLAEHISHSESKIVSDENLAILARQLALHANLASMVSCSLKAHGQDPYASNWLERLRKIKRLKEKVESSVVNNNGASKDVASPKNSKSLRMDDFTEYT